MKTTIRYCVLSILCVFTLTFLFSLNASGQSNTCAGATPLVSSPGCSTTAGSITAATTYTAGTGLPGTICSSTNPDVWYSFVAASSNPTITLIQTSGTANIRRFQIFSGTCAGGLTELFCSGNSNTLTASALVPGQTYLIRIYSNVAGSFFGFTICITDPNDLCANGVTLTSSTTCNNAPGNMFGATLTAVTVNAPNCAPGGITRDVWYRFVAQTTNPTITMSGVGVNLTGNVGMQLLTNTCTNPLTSLFCGTTSIATNFLTPGTIYYLRVYSTGGVPASQVGWSYNICITDPVTPPPSNDNCSGAVNLAINNGCNNNAGNMAGATPSTPALGASCAGFTPDIYDVWYKFAAIGTSTVVDLSSLGTNFVNPAIEVFSCNPTNPCGTLVSIACGVEPLTVPGLTVGNTYYIRVYSRTAPLPNGNSRFNICLTSTAAPVVRFGNSYVNITKKTTGGVVEPGDILEIRMTINHTSGSTFSNLRYIDNVPTKTTMLTGATDFIKVITNEGLTYKQYTRAAGDDAATYLPSPPAGEFNIRMNLGFGSNPGIPANNTATEFASAMGSMTNTNRPTVFGNSLLFATAYRVRVTGVVGDTITLFPARFIYRTGGSDVTLTATPYKILISNPLSLCANSIGLNNAVEFGGTFGSGANLNRGTDLTTPIPGYSFMNDVNTYNHEGDGRYAIVKNISPRSSTNKNAGRAGNCPVLAFDDPLNCNNRMHGGHWYIDGDHTGTNNAAGNLPPGPATSSGYMLMVNADYVASEVYNQTLTNLCPNTYYEFSGWFRNICPTCGADSVGAQFAGTVTAPTNGYPGVYPNLSFSLNGLDYYSTGEIDTVGWLKKGFVFRTGPSQTNATFSIRNNSQGGGGNDWVMDDIAVATCLPTMSYSPTINPAVCTGNAIVIADTISSFFRNYTTYKWQKSTNGGGSWTDITGVTTLPDTNYYITTFTVPPGSTTMADSGTLYRVVVATTPANLTDPNCNISDGVTITLSVNNCGIPLKTDLLSFNGKIVNDKGHLSWTTSKEDMPVTFILERSNDGVNFAQTGTVNSYNDYMSPVNSYSFVDPISIVGKAYYRLILAEQSGARKFSRTIQLNKADSDGLGLVSVINPFNHTLEFDIASKTDAKIEVELLDLFGKVVQKGSYTVRPGINALSMPNTDVLPSGTYILRVRNNEVFINRKVLKKNF